MELDLSVSTIIATTFFVIAVLASVLHKRPNSEKTRRPPQAKGAWPIIGHLHLLGGSPQLPHKVLGDMADIYGPIFTIKLGIHQGLVVSNAEMTKDLFTTNDKVFASRPQLAAGEHMAYNSAMFGISPYGDYWRKVRKIMTLEVLSQRRVEMLGPIRASELRASLKDIYDGWVKNKESENSDMVKVDMQQWFGKLILNVVVRVISGKRFLPNDEEGFHFQNVVRKYFELFGEFVVSDYIPYLKFLDIGGHNRAMKKTGKDLDNIFEGWLKEHKMARESPHQHQGNEVFINVLINILQGASKEEFFEFDHDTIIKSTCQQLLTAGMDTTSATLTWALSLLLNNPKTLEIALAELDEHVGRERLVEESDMKNLVYLEAIIKETLRLYPAAPLSVVQESVDDCVVGGYDIPKGTRLLVNLSKLHLDPNVWSDPYEFRPERFLTSHKDIDVKGKHFELLPFGGGRRICPGVSFALQAARVALAAFLQQFEIKKTSSEAIDMTESFGMTNSKATPLEVLLAPRLSLHMYDVAA